MALKQQSRSAELKTPFGKDELVLTRFDGSEGLSEVFSYSMEAISETEDINFDKALGSKCTVSIKGHDGTRHFNGILVEAQWIGTRDLYFNYRMVLRPWFWLLSHVSDCRIYSNKTALEIISDVFSRHGFAKYQDKTSENYPVLEYFVQYRETDFAFVSRIMEEFGIYYFFEHGDDEHTMILADAKSSHSPLPNGGTIPYRPVLARSQHRDEHLNQWVPGRRFNTGRVVLDDYDHLKPSASLLAESEGSSGYQNSKLELFDYPGRYDEKSDGDKYAKVRLEAEQASDNRCQAAGNAVNLFPGALVNLKGHSVGSQNREYLIVRSMHSYASEAYRSGGAPDADEPYSGRFEFLPSDKPFRCPMITPKPVVRGPQTAKVVGDGEIDIDEHGRIIVQFHWDRNKDESRRVRIGQVWSGKKWGGIFIPRVGMEVIVEFLEGDPDRPLVVGTVYNDEYKPPYDLPGDKNIAGWKSDSTEGGGGYNEFIFDDTKGRELIRVHAEKDMDATIENDDKQTVKNDRKVKVDGNHDEKIGKVMTVEAMQKIELKVGMSTIVMTPSSIELKSPMITLNAMGSIALQAPKIDITGYAMVTITTTVTISNLLVGRLNGGTPVITM